MFPCLLGEVVSYLFYSKWPMEVNWWIHLNYYAHKEHKGDQEKRLQHKRFPVNSEFGIFKNTFY